MNIKEKGEQVYDEHFDFNQETGGGY